MSDISKNHEMSDVQSDSIKLVKPAVARINMRVPSEVKDRLIYWSGSRDQTMTDFILDATDHYIGWLNKDYDLPAAEIRRLNQLVQLMEQMIVSNRNLEKTVIDGFDSIIGLVRGDNYLSSLGESAGDVL